MNCDQAFEAMTDPARDDSLLLMEHLAACPRCREMYETLEPALGLFDVPDAESASERERHFTVEMMPSVQMAQQVATRLTPQDRSTTRRTARHRHAGAIVASGILGFLLSFSVMMLINDGHSTSPVIVTECSWLNREETSDSEDASDVVHTCVTCHLAQNTESVDGVSSLMRSSFHLERLVRDWHQVSRDVIHSSPLIAWTLAKDSHHV